jgi:HAD superfamily hydrolase (TIGR01509 family)
MKIALATSTSRETAEFNLHSAGVSEFFDALVCGGAVVNGKPHPEVFLTAAQRLGLEPGDCAAFEDSINGIKSAFAAGMVTVMVPDFLKPTEEIKPMISCLCSDLTEAIPFLEEK